MNRVTDWLRSNPLFLLLVIAPTCLAVVYYGLIAPDVYISESRFVVRAQQQASQSPLADLFKSRGGDEANSIHDYILSRDALQEVEKQHSLRHAYSRDIGGFLDGFPGLSWDHSLEKLYRYYVKHVGVDADPVSSISVLTVRAFTAEDAYRINSLLLELSERLVNSLNERSRQDLIRFAAEEVQMASDKATEASLALLRYRNMQSVFQPDQQATLQLAGVAKIQDELIATEAQIAQIGQLSPNNPQIRALQSRAEALRNSMTVEAAKVTSANGSFSARSPEFTRLTLESGFADKQLGYALAELEKARSEARQKQIYLERVVQPGKPDKATEPLRIRGSFTVLLVSVIVWLMTRLLMASVREHAD